jgi:adenylyltransferase/sulfurtransferase
MKFQELKLRRDPECPICGEHPTITKLIDYEMFCGISPEPERQDMHPDEVTVQDMKRALDDPKLGIKVIDVREPDEYEIAHVEGTTLMPMSALQQRFTELDPNSQYYIHCKMGGRSMRALQFLRQQGFKNLKNVAGGIDAWSEEIDPGVPRY